MQRKKRKKKVEEPYGIWVISKEKPRNATPRAKLDQERYKRDLEREKRIRSGANIQHQPQEQSSGRARWREKGGLGTVEVRGKRSGKVWDVASNLASAAFPRPS